MTSPSSDITLPPALLPADGRFGSGPSKVRSDSVEALAKAAPTYLGTSHRQATVRFMVAALRNGLAELFSLPDGYEIALGNGGTTAFWDAATFGLIRQKSLHLTFGEFSSKFAACVEAAPHLADPDVLAADYGTAPELLAGEGVDTYCLTHNETSTGVAVEPVRPAAADPDALVLVDATSAAGGLRFDPTQADAYYFAPQKGLASEGGLWLAALSPAAIDRIERMKPSAPTGRWAPAFLDLSIALDNSRKDQTYNTPALATIFLAQQQVEWILEQGGLPWSAARCDQSADILYGWAEARDWASPYVTDPALRSHVVATIDLDDSIPAATVSSVLRSNGILDTESYRKLGRNQLRIALYPAIDPADVQALTACIDHIVEKLA